MKLHQSVTNDWLPWFAWYPVRLEDGRLIWLEYVQRKWYHENRVPVSPSSWVIYRQPKK